MIDYKLGQEYAFEVAFSKVPTKKVRRKKMTTKTPLLHFVKDKDNNLLKLYHPGKLRSGRIIKCMVNGFNEDKTPKLVLSLTEQPISNRPRPDATRTSAHLIYTPMGNKR